MKEKRKRKPVAPSDRQKLSLCSRAFECFLALGSTRSPDSTQEQTRRAHFQHVSRRASEGLVEHESRESDVEFG